VDFNLLIPPTFDDPSSFTTIQFFNESSDPAGAALSATWSFGEGGLVPDPSIRQGRRLPGEPDKGGAGVATHDPQLTIAHAARRCRQAASAPWVVRVGTATSVG
jgi:hypothetical protein